MSLLWSVLFTRLCLTILSRALYTHLQGNPFGLGFTGRAFSVDRS